MPKLSDDIECLLKIMEAKRQAAHPKDLADLDELNKTAS
jgi:hypothetical protein